LILHVASKNTLSPKALDTQNFSLLALLHYFGEDFPSTNFSTMADSSAAPPGTSLPAAVPLPPSGHKPGFVQPSSYLRPQNQKRPMTSRSEKQTDKDEKLALVSYRISIDINVAPYGNACAHDYAASRSIDRG
jgi:hypothetical protein